MHLMLHDAMPMHWAVAVAGIALVTLALLYLANRRLGISTGFEDLCSLVLAVQAGALTGAALFGSLYPRLWSFFELPPLTAATGEG